MQDKAVFTKEDILSCLSKKGYYVDSFTLDTFLNKLDIKSIYEQDGIEYFETQTADTIIEKVFNKTQLQGADVENDKDLKQTKTDEMMPSIDVSSTDEQDDSLSILKEVSLSDGSNLMERVQNMSIVDVEDNKEQIEKELKEKERKNSEKKLDVAKRPGLLEMAMKSVESKVETKPQETLSQDEFEDLVTLSNSFKELGVKEFEAQSIRNDKGLQLSKQMNDIAKVMAKKIAKYVGAICMQEAKSAIKLAESQEEILKLNQKIRVLEEQIKKIRLLLAESNRNLNSYKPFAFGLYKKLKTKKR